MYHLKLPRGYKGKHRRARTTYHSPRAREHFKVCLERLTSTWPWKPLPSVCLPGRVVTTPTLMRRRGSPDWAGRGAPAAWPQIRPHRHTFGGAPGDHVSRRGWFWHGRRGADISGPAKGRRRRNVGMSKVVRGDGEEAHRGTARAPNLEWLR
jgi:hypothetical protein